MSLHPQIDEPKLIMIKQWMSSSHWVLKKEIISISSVKGDIVGLIRSFQLAGYPRVRTGLWSNITVLCSSLTSLKDNWSYSKIGPAPLAGPALTATIGNIKPGFCLHYPFNANLLFLLLEIYLFIVQSILNNITHGHC